MSRMTMRMGIPLMGADFFQPDRVGPVEGGKWAARQMDGWRYESNRIIRPWPNVAALGNNTPTSNTITGLRNISWGDGDADDVRHTGTSFHELLSGAWTSRAGAFALAAGTTDYWGGAVVPSAGSNGKGVYLFSCRSATGGLNHIFFWTGAGNMSNTWSAGAPSPGRHVVSFADRAFVFNQIIGGATRSRACQWSIAGDALSWTGTGSGAREFGEFDDEITGVATLRGKLYVYSSRAIVEGTESFDVDAPVYYSPLTTNGVGCWAPGSLASFNDQHAFLSMEGFKLWDGQQIHDIGTPVDEAFFNSINRAAVNTVCSTVLPEPFNMIIWGLPMFGATTPSYMLAYDYKRKAWITSVNFYFVSVGSNVTALATRLRSSGITWGDLQLAGTTWANMQAAGTRWSDLAATAAFPSVVSGHANGVTRIWEQSTTNPNLTVILDTPMFKLSDAPLYDSASARPTETVDEDDIITLDSVEVVYRTTNDTTPTALYILTSVDEGRTYVYYGTVTIDVSRTNTTRRYRVDGIASGYSMIIRIANFAQIGTTNVQSRASIGLVDIVPTFSTSGKEVDPSTL